MGLFGRGSSAAMTLREGILRALGAEEEWLERNGDGGFVAWMTSPAATFFHLSPGPDDAPDLGVLRIVTPVAVVADWAAADHECDQLNREATVSRWAFVTTGREDEQALALTCSFVVGPHNLDELTGFAVWCAREQIADAAAALGAGIAKKIGDGAPYGWGPLLPRAPRAEPHPLTLARPRQAGELDRPSAALAEQAYAACTDLLKRMADQGTAQWGRRTDAPILAFEVPMSWDDYPEGLIGMDVSEETPPTAVVEASRDDHPRAGNGLRLTMFIPWRPVKDVEVMVAEMNAQAGDTKSASHILGAWALEDYPVRDSRGKVTHTSPNYRYTLYLPAEIADEERGVDLPAVMREALLTFARMALIARRMHGPREGLRDDDYLHVGLDAPYVPHGLAWGETGEGRNPGALALEEIYGWLVGQDTDWADAHPGGFRWWPGDLMQSFWLYQDEEQGATATLSMLAEVRDKVPDTPENLTAIARANYDLSLSTLLLADSGKLMLAASLPAGAYDDRHFPLLAQVFAAGQFTAARELRSRLGGLGEPAVSAHPFSGPRPEDGARFALREEALVPLAEKTRADLTPRVALLAVAGQLIPPYRMEVRGDGGLDYAWRPSQFGGDGLGALGDALVQVSVFPGESPAGPGWIVRTRLPVSGDLAARARWCNEQNAVLFAPDTETASLLVPGGWGLSPDGECCLTSWLPPSPDATELGRVLYLGRVAADHQKAVHWALARTGPGGVTTSPTTQPELAAGLTETVAAFRSVLGYPVGVRCAVESGPAGVTVTLAAPPGDLGALAETSGDTERTTVLVPASVNHTELAIAYAALLGRSASRIEAGNELDLVPGELPRWQFPEPALSRTIAQLEDAGILSVPERGDGFLFPAGPGQGSLWIEFLPLSRLHGALPIRISGGADGLTLADAARARDIDVLGTWRQREDGARYEVTIPPAGLLWNSDPAIHGLLTLIFRHVIRQVQSAAETL